MFNLQNYKKSINMKTRKSINRRIRIFAVLAIFIATAMSMTSRDIQGWKLVWSEDFDNAALNDSIWSKIPRGGADWNRHMASYDSLYSINNGILTLRGVNNSNLEADTARFLTGGIWSKGKHQFEPGRIEVKARLGNAQGAWPAIWLLPADTVEYGWPKGGEIDMMEHLNYDTIAYQTVHSIYTLYEGGENTPPHFGTARIKMNDWNVFGVDILPEALVFHLNGEETFRYPRIDSIPGQYPYYLPMYLLIDMQIQGGWVGKADPATLPVKMEIDWIRHYKK